jgi:hypothetical protein
MEERDRLRTRVNRTLILLAVAILLAGLLLSQWSIVQHYARLL